MIRALRIRRLARLQPGSRAAAWSPIHIRGHERGSFATALCTQPHVGRDPPSVEISVTVTNSSPISRHPASHVTQCRASQALGCCSVRTTTTVVSGRTRAPDTRNRPKGNMYQTLRPGPTHPPDRVHSHRELRTTTARIQTTLEHHLHSHISPGKTQHRRRPTHSTIRLGSHLALVLTGGEAPSSDPPTRGAAPTAQLPPAPAMR